MELVQVFVLHLVTMVAKMVVRVVKVVVRMDALLRVEVDVVKVARGLAIKCVLLIVYRNVHLRVVEFAVVHVSLVAKGGAIQHAQEDVVEDVAVIVEEIVLEHAKADVPLLVLEVVQVELYLFRINGTDKRTQTRVE